MFLRMLHRKGDSSCRLVPGTRMGQAIAQFFLSSPVHREVDRMRVHLDSLFSDQVDAHIPEVSKTARYAMLDVETRWHHSFFLEHQW